MDRLLHPWCFFVSFYPCLKTCPIFQEVDELMVLCSKEQPFVASFDTINDSFDSSKVIASFSVEPSFVVVVDSFIVIGCGVSNFFFICFNNHYFNSCVTFFYNYIFSYNLFCCNYKSYFGYFGLPWKNSSSFSYHLTTTSSKRASKLRDYSFGRSSLIYYHHIAIC